MREIICNKIGVKAVTSHTKNLGLLVIFGRPRKEVFSFVQERIWKKLRPEREMLVQSGKRDFDQSSGLIHSKLYHELLQDSGRVLQQY